ncbi:MAG: CDF family Co(II)/Ni(II) efflux transporter DmeF [Candidatus Nitricoxidivorans perseverans]|uniref:CDF family Co(II)/Ni(II) efflux transporter DmeF n=1 Tax=Candidatus Nitricoxidivorans perseverans TaxID=2975601 RepID=A0AA49IXD8_9PROT|nr:MAG: CDF family Co(II)/Ni(II) efflux transporter DmeF [Candidatus Nitricoxidivorans perseverans]
MEPHLPLHDLRRWQHSHDFSTDAEVRAERRTRWVVALTLATMAVELAAGWLTGSMALLADGWHMASHATALGLAVFAYRFARRHATDARFTFGTGKVTALAGYSSAALLGAIAAWMAWESSSRLFVPVAIHYAEAMAIAVFGLAVNLASARLLDHDHDHDHGHHHDDHGHRHDHDHVDHNLRAAYLHVLADALTSLLAIAALAGGMLFGWRFLDPLMGIVGALVVGRWAWGLARDSAGVLLDAEDHGAAEADIRRIIESEPDHEVADLHLWRIGPTSRACILSLVTHSPHPVEHYRERLSGVAGIEHLTVEIRQCHDDRCLRR